MSQPLPLQVFISYSHKDDQFRRELETHLSALKQQGVIAPWSDGAIEAGQEWEPAIRDKLETVDIILLLVSADFLASRFIAGVELQRAMARHAAGQARVIPVLLRPCDWQAAPFCKLQAVPDGAKPIAKWGNCDEAFTRVAQAIRRVAEILHQSGSLADNGIKDIATLPGKLAENMEKLISVLSIVHNDISNPRESDICSRKEHESRREQQESLKEVLETVNVQLIEAMFSRYGIRYSLKEFCDEPSEDNWEHVQENLRDGARIIDSTNEVLDNISKGFGAQHSNLLRILKTHLDMKRMMVRRYCSKPMPTDLKLIQKIRELDSDFDIQNQRIKDVQDKIVGYIDQLSTQLSK